MKKYLLLTCIAALTCAFSFATEIKKINQPQKQSPNSTFGTDVIIEDTSGFDQTIVKLTTAFNGWQYAAFNTVDLGHNKGGLTIRVSKDGGAMWTNIDSYTFSLVRFPAFDIVVAGSDTSHLTLYVAGAKQDLSSGNYNLFIDTYNGNTGVSKGETYNIQNTEGGIHDVSVASDYAFPGAGASPYSVGVLYSSSSYNADSIIFIGSMDGGATWGVNQTVMITTNYFRKVSIAYGHSATASNGLYFGAWEMIISPSSTTGSIYSSRTDSMENNTWATPVWLDSVTPSRIGLCSNPSVAVSFGSTDNDSGSVTEDVLVDLDSEGDGSDYDIVGFYNKHAHSTDFWFGHDVITTTEMDKQPSISYCAGTSTFMCTYFDSTDQFLPMAVNDLNFTTPDTWVYVTNQYNDATNGLTNPNPQISVDPSVNKASFAWIQNNGTNDQALFDSEGSTVSVPDHEKQITGLAVYPNPAAHNINVSVSLKSSSRVKVDIYSSLGQVIISEDLGTLESGISNRSINIESLSNGNYFVKVTGDRFLETEKMIIAK